MNSRILTTHDDNEEKIKMFAKFAGAVIATPPGPFGTIHEGIVYFVDKSGRKLVIENSNLRGGVVVSTLEGFSGGGQWRIVRMPPAGRENEIIHRALNMVGRRKYHVLDYNCQHFVSEVYDGKPSSWQLPGYGLLAFFFGIALLPEKKKKRRRRK